VRIRLGFLLTLALLSAGCQSQSPYGANKPAAVWNPFDGLGQSRVPPPGTYQYGTSTLAPTQGYAVPPGTPYGPVPPGAQTPFSGAQGGAIAPGAASTASVPQTNNTSDAKVGSLGPPISNEIRRASYEDPAYQHPRQASQPSGGPAGSYSPSPADLITPY
jgi:hypothetical protein